jgi:hypothetical protein
MGGRMTRTVFVLGTLASAAIALAQTKAFDSKIVNIALLQFTEVKNELKVTQAQRDKMNAAAKPYNDAAAKVEAKLKAKKEPTKTEADNLASLAKSMRTKVVAILTETQLRRLREITLQEIGIPALADQDVSKFVGLSEAQRKKIDGILVSAAKKAGKIEQDAMLKLEAEFGGKKPKTDKEKKELQEKIQARMKAASDKAKPQIQAIQKDAKAQVMKVMNAKQSAAWNKALGKPFTP